MELDCHGKTWAEALAEFIARYKRGAASRQRGYAGHHTRVRLYRRRRDDTGASAGLFWIATPTVLEWQPGESVDGNQGHTLVRPGRPLPEAGDLLAEQVWEYCARPRAASKITGKFRRHGDDRTLEAIRALEREGRLRSANRGRVKTYQAV